MSQLMKRAVLGAMALFLAMAVGGASTASAQIVIFGDADFVTTGCGSGTVNHCGEKPVTECSWSIDVDLNIFSKTFGLHIRKSDCKITGHTPLYKDRGRGEASSSALFRGEPERELCSQFDLFRGLPGSNSCYE